MFRRFGLLICSVVLAFAFSRPGFAQTTTATLSGVVTDETGGVLPGAQVTVSNVATGVRRSTATDDRGRFLAPQLPPGPYELTVSLSGFDTLVRRGITLTVGQEASLNLPMRVGAVTEQVTVVGEAPLVNTSTSSVAGIVEEKRIAELPLNGRDFTQLALIEPGVVSVRNSDQIATKGFGTRIAAAGSRADQTAWLLDGTNIKSMANFGTPGSSSGLLLGVDAVREFQVLTSNYTAEYGGNSGAVVNMITKSGTNEFHGSAYAFHRNDNLDARNFFDIPDKPEFKRNQFGVSLGGPIKSDRLFFFGNYEGVRARRGVTSLALVPDENAHRGMIPNAQGGLTQVQVAASTRPFLDLYPLPNANPLLDSRGNPTGLGNLFVPGSNRVNQDYFMGRVDYNVSENSTLFGRFTLDDTENFTPDTIPVTDNVVPTYTGYYTIQYERIVSPRFLSTSRLAFNRTVLDSDVVLNVDFPAGTFTFHRNVPSNVDFTGGTGIGPSDRNVFGSTQSLWQGSQSFFYSSGNHTLRFGGGLEFYEFNNFGGGGDSGTFSWGSLREFLEDDELEEFSVSVPGSSTHRSFRQEVISMYIQDDWRWRPNFTWNLGLRYEPFTTPRERHGRVSVVKDWLNGTRFDVGVPFWDNPSLKNFAPRVGFAWDLKGDGKTAVRSGFGVFHVNTLGFYYRSMSQKNPPFAGNVEETLGNMVETIAAVRQLGPEILTPEFHPNSLLEVIEWDLSPSYEMKFNLTVERELPGNSSLLIGYLGGRGVHLWRSNKINACYSTIVNGREFVASGCPRPNPRASEGDMRHSDAQSFYNGLQLRVSKRFERDFQFHTSYTWSKTIDDSTTGTANSDYQEGHTSRPWNTKIDRGLSALHLAHNFVVNGLWAVPFPANVGVASHLLGGWNVSGILSATTGAPFTVRMSGRHIRDQGGSRQRPDFVGGRSLESVILGKVEQYFDPSAFVRPPTGVYGDFGRNVLEGPGFAKLDLTLKKDFPVGMSEGSRVEFRTDFFNILNRANFGKPSEQVINGNNGSPIAAAGKISTTVSSSRQLQFSLKLVF